MFVGTAHGPCWHTSQCCLQPGTASPRGRLTPHHRMPYAEQCRQMPHFLPNWLRTGTASVQCRCPELRCASRHTLGISPGVSSSLGVMCGRTWASTWLGTHQPAAGPPLHRTHHHHAATTCLMRQLNPAWLPLLLLFAALAGSQAGKGAWSACCQSSSAVPKGTLPPYVRQNPARHQGMLPPAAAACSQGCPSAGPPSVQCLAHPASRCRGAAGSVCSSD